MSGFYNLATTDESRIRQWWTWWPNANIGISTDRLLVVDIDPAKGGWDSYELLKLWIDFPETLQTQTWSDGAHVIMRLPEGVTVSNDQDGKLGHGIDVRSHHGYIVAPGSEIAGKYYRVASDGRIGLAPKELIAECKKPRPKSQNAGQRICDEDDTTFELIERYLASKHVPKANEGSRNHIAVVVANRFYDFAAKNDTCRHYLLAWNEKYSDPPLDESELRTVAGSAERTRQKSIGCDHPMAPGFEPTEIDESKRPELPTPKPAEPTKLTRGLYYVPFDVAAAGALELAAEPLIKGLLDRGAMSVWYGESNTGKTFVALDAAWHVAAGQKWAGMRVRQGAVLYLAPEGGQGIYKRAAAILGRRPGAVPLYIVPCPVNLLRADADLRALTDMAANIEKLGTKIELIVVDTLSRALAGGDENSSVDMGGLVRNFDALRSIVGAHLAVVHHTGKDKARGARGHSLLRAATDTEIEIADRTVTPTKQRDMDSNKPLTFRLVPVRLGADPDGEPVTSCVVEMSKAGETIAPETIALSPERKDLLDAIVTGRNVHCANNAAADRYWFTTAMALECAARLPTHDGRAHSPKSSAMRRRVGHALREMSKKGHIKKVKHGQWVLLNGRNTQDAQNLTSTKCAHAQGSIPLRIASDHSKTSPLAVQDRRRRPAAGQVRQVGGMR
jgi:hypothetical protein